MGRGRHCRGNKAEAGRPDRRFLMQSGGGEQLMVAQAQSVTREITRNGWILGLF